MKKRTNTTMSRNIPLLIAVFLVFSLTSGFAAESKYQDLKGDRLLVPLGKFLQHRADGSIKKIFAAVEGVIEVLSVTEDNTVILTAKGDKPASTQLCIWYSDGRRVWHEVETYDQKTLVREILETRLGEKELEVVVLPDAVYLKGTVSSPEKVLEAQKIVEEQIGQSAFAGQDKTKVYNLLKVAGVAAGPEQKISEAIKIPTVKVTCIRPLSESMAIAAQPVDPATGLPVNPNANVATAPSKLRVILEGTVKTQADYQHMVEVVRSFVENEDSISNLVVIEDPIQVTFQAYVLQVNRNNLKDLGIDWGGAQSLADGLTQGTLRFVENISNAYRGDQQANGAPVERSWNPFAMNNVNRFDIIAAQVKAWETKSKVKVLSNPKLTVYANATANKLGKAGWFDEKKDIDDETQLAKDSGLAFVNVGQDVFYISSRDTAGNVSWAKAEAALKLTIRDLFVHDNDLKFTVFAKQDEPSFSRGTEAPPDILKRSVMTTVKISNGETVVLGGLIQNSKSVSERGLPVLSKLPYVGRLFRNKSTQTQENELVILLTPEIKGREANFDRTKKYEVVPVPRRSERLEQLHQMFQQIKGSHFPPEAGK